MDRIISLAVALHRNQYLEPKITVDERPIMYKMIKKLLDYLHTDFTVYHFRAVNLIWALQGSTTRPHVESILAQSMISPEARNVATSYEAFGVLWRLSGSSNYCRNMASCSDFMFSEDNLLPGFCFKIPMMTILDTLKSDDALLRRVGETWMRCSLKSYIR